MTVRRSEQMMIKNTIKLRQIGFAGTAFALLSIISGCVGLETNQNQIDLSAYSSLTTVDAVKKLESNLKASEKNKLAIFAPQHYSTADQALIDARSLIKKNEPRAQVVQKVAVASAVLRNGDIVMRKVKDILEEQLIVKEKLDSLKTKKVYRSEYGSLEERLNSIIREIEGGEVTNNEKNRGKLLKDLQKLERRAIRYNAMHEPEEILKRVKYRGGKKLAPLTYEDAFAVFQHAEDFIAQNPNYEAGIEQMGQEALFAAKRALYITEQVAALSQKVSISLEQVILDEEYRLYRVARELDSVDLRDNPLEMQSEQLANIAKNKADEYRNKEGLILALRDTLIKVRDSSSELTALNDKSIRLKKEKGEWLAKEALYKAKVSHLESNFTKSQLRLDQTQQKLLSLKDENNLLFETLNKEKINAEKLQLQISSAKIKLEKLPLTLTPQTLAPQEPALTLTPTPPAQTPTLLEPQVLTPLVSTATPNSVTSESAKVKSDVTETPAEVEIQANVKEISEEVIAPIVQTTQAADAETTNTKIANTETPEKEINISENNNAEIKPLAIDIVSEINPEISRNETANVAPKATPKLNEIQTDIPSEVSKATIENKTAKTTQQKVSHKQLAASTISNNTPVRPKITEQETLDALKSIRELISIKPIKIESELSTTETTDDMFVDASE